MRDDFEEALFFRKQTPIEIYRGLLTKFCIEILYSKSREKVIIDASACSRDY